MNNIDWGHPFAMYSPLTTIIANQTAAMNVIVEANLKRYFPFQYRMMKSMQAAMEKAGG